MINNSIKNVIKIIYDIVFFSFLLYPINVNVQTKEEGNMYEKGKK